MGAHVARWLYIGIVVVYAIAVYFMATRSIRAGKWAQAALCCWLASPVPMLFVAVVMERREIRQLLDPSVQSWAFLFGDTLFLPFAVAMLALAWRRLPRTEGTSWYLTKRRWATTLMWGFAAGIIAHIREDMFYSDLALNSPTKLLHDICAYAVLVGAVIYGLWPALSVKASRQRALVALCGVLLWFGAVYVDNAVRHLDGRNLHIEYDWGARSPAAR